MNINIRSIVLIVAAVFIAGVTAILARSWLSTERPQQETAAAPAPRAELEILVARHDLPAGRIVQQGDLRWQAWPNVSLPEQYIRNAGGNAGDNTINTLTGGVVRSGLRAGEPLTVSRVARPGDHGFMAAVITPGMRAITVRVDPTSGIAGFIFPGDRVDLILSHRIEDPDNRRESRAGETVLTNVRVVAIDQRTNDQSNTPSPANTVTLEVSPKQVERVVVARALGDLSLSLRSLADPAMAAELEDGGFPLNPGQPVPGDSYTWDSEVSKVLSGKTNKATAVTVARGGQIERVNVEDDQ
ncbi:MAG: Flp pilus assembly protein CpaB [Sphingomonadales bacterium]